MSKNKQDNASTDSVDTNADVQALQEQLTQVSTERDALAAQLADAQANLADAQAKLQAAAAPAKSGHAGQGTHLRVCSKSPAGSHRRAGRVWTNTPADVALADLTAEQVAQLRSCPLTIVVDI